MAKDIEKIELGKHTALELIYECGVLDMSIDDVIYLLAQRVDKNQLRQALENPQSAEYEALHRGRAEGKFRLLSALHQAAELVYDGSFNALTEQRRSDAINQKIKENFGL